MPEQNAEPLVPVRDEPDRIDYLPVSLLAEIVYCPRNFYYRMVEGWEDVTSAQMLKGRIEEERRAERPVVQHGDLRQVRSVAMSSETLRVITVLDAVEETESGTLRPVEYKTGHAPLDEPAGTRFPEFGVRPEHVQLCAQAMVLEEHLGQAVDRGYVYYTASRVRREVAFTPDLRQKVLEVLGVAWALLDADRPPAPVADGRCPGCSFFAHCQPYEVEALRSSASATPPQRVLPPDLPARTLYVDAQGAVLRKRGGQLVVERQQGASREVCITLPALSVEQVVLVGGVQVSTQALRALMKLQVDVVYLSTYGRFLGRIETTAGPNARIRLAQYSARQDAARALGLARTFVSAKLANMRVLLLRYRRSLNDPALQHAADAISSMLRRVPEAADTATLMGLEGQASRAYFGVFGRLLHRNELPFGFEKRTRRPPQDPVNALLGFGYALLLADLVAACCTAGLDPHVGFLHTARHGRPALALDLMEAFRPIVADAVVLALLNKGMIGEAHFERQMGGILLNEAGRKQFYRAYSNRKQEEVTHPVFGYRMPYHRLFAVQARLLAKVLTGDLPEYLPFTVR